MSLYQQAVSDGAGALQLLATGENAATKEAYNNAYAVAAARSNIAKQRSVAQSNLSAIQRDKVLSNVQIQMNQDQAAAAVLVTAAASGTSGSSVDSSVYDTERNAAFALGAVSKKAEQLSESELATIGSSTSALLSIEDQEISYIGDLLTAFSSFESNDLKISESLNSEGINLTSLWGA